AGMLLVVPVAGSNQPFDEQFRALLYIIANDLRQPRIGDDVVPLGPVLPVPLLILVALRGRQAEVRDHGPAAGGPNLGVLAHIPQQENLIHALCHLDALFLLLPQYNRTRDRASAPEARMWRRIPAAAPPCSLSWKSTRSLMSTAGASTRTLPSLHEFFAPGGILARSPLP